MEEVYLRNIRQNYEKLSKTQKAFLISTMLTSKHVRRAELINVWKEVKYKLGLGESKDQLVISAVGREIADIMGFNINTLTKAPVEQKYLFNLLCAMVLDEDYEIIASFFYKTYSEVSRFSGYYFPYSNFMLTLNIAESIGSNFNGILSKLYFDSNEEKVNYLVNNIVKYPPPQEWLEMMEIENRLNFLSTLFYGFLLSGNPIPNWFWEYTAEFAKSEVYNKGHDFYFLFAQHALVKADLKLIEGLLPKMLLHHREITEAVLLCFEEEYLKADPLFESGFKLWRKVDEKRSIPFASPFGMVYGFSILVNHEKDFIKKFKKIKLLNCGIYEEGFSRIRKILPKLIDRKEHFDLEDYEVCSISLIFVYWVKRYLVLENPNAVYLNFSIYEKTKYFFDSECFWWLNEFYNNDFFDQNDLFLRKLFPKLTLPIPKGYAERPKWEIWLDSLEDTLSRYSEKQSEKRVIWRVKNIEREITPIEQKRLKSGKWSKGRTISLSRIKDGEYDFQDERDARIVSALKSIYWYNNLYEFDFNEALFLLVGRDNVFIDDKHHTPLQIKLAQPSIHLKREKNGSFKLNLKPQSDGSIFYEFVSYNLVEVTKFDDRVYDIGKVINSINGKFPPEGFSKLVDWLKKAQKLVKLSGDIPEELMGDLPVIKSDGKLLVKIVPDGANGFIGELHLHPSEPFTRLLPAAQGFEKFTEEIDDKIYCISRNLTKEKKNLERIKSLTESLGLNFLKEESYIEFSSELEMLSFLESSQLLVDSNVLEIEVLKDQNNRIISYVKPSVLQLNLKSSSGWLNLIGEDIEIDDQLSLKFSDLLSFSAQDETNFFKLKDDDYVLISQSLKRKMRQLSLVSSSGKEEIKVHPIAAMYLESVVDDGQIQTSKSRGWTKKLKEIKLLEENNYPIPENLQATLRGYQYTGFQWLCRRADQGFGSCLADDMGLGKTIQSIAVLLQRSQIGPALVVAPTSVCANWESELKKFAPDLNTFNLYDEDGSSLIPKLNKGDVLISSYGLLTNQIEEIEKVSFASVILDEAQAIKNPDAKRSKAACRINAEARWVTTGTPIENSLQELWSIFRFINTGLLGSLKSFRERFVIPIENHENQWVASQLRNIVQPFLLRRTKNEVLTDLPPKTEINRQVVLNKIEITFYETLRKKAKEELAEAAALPPGQRHIQIFSVLTKLRLAACSPSLVDPELNMGSSKMEALTELLDEILPGGHQVLIFSQFVKHLSLIREELKKQKIDYFYLDGSTSPKKRKKLVKEFEEGKCPVFLLSLKAGGTGINLTSASYVVHMDPWWNPAVEDQATDRAHRIGQDKPVTVYRLLAKNTIEEKIHELHQSKRNLADQIISEQSSSKLNLEEVVELIFS